jgi:hypothetical protein
MVGLTIEGLINVLLLMTYAEEISTIILLLFNI